MFAVFASVFEFVFERFAVVDVYGVVAFADFLGDHVFVSVGFEYGFEGLAGVVGEVGFFDE